jgi:hypothetical protein
MSERLRLLFVGENPVDSTVYSHFQSCLEREGCHPVLTIDAEGAARTLLFPHVVDAILIHHDNISRGSSIASGLKLISPQIPVLLISGQWPDKGMFPCGVDAICYARILSSRAAHDIATFLSHFLVRQSQKLVEGPASADRRFVPSRPVYLN